MYVQINISECSGFTGFLGMEGECSDIGPGNNLCVQILLGGGGRSNVNIV